jgi:hypothetical protein
MSSGETLLFVVAISMSALAALNVHRHAYGWATFDVLLALFAMMILTKGS